MFQILFSHFRIIPPKVSSSEKIGTFERQVGNKAIQKLSTIKKEPILANHFWYRNHFVNTVGADEDIIRRYTQHQRKQDKKEENNSQNFYFV